MTPVAHGWTEADYYRARDAARSAWEARDEQLTIGALEEEEPGRGNRRRSADCSTASGSSSSSVPTVLPVASPGGPGRSIPYHDAGAAAPSLDLGGSGGEEHDR